ncbi:DNA-binding protein [Phyllosticta capitalensis]|uniref:DNA-binding protein n=1 Tax=Phyllosticta capitalensis TaxID=121624 RepID=A0ABR1YV53_9PEZI
MASPSTTAAQGQSQAHRRGAPPATFTALIGAFTSFLTVSLHTILYHRGLYPRASFLTSRAYNYPVAQSRHPAVCAWLADAVAAVEAELLRCRARSVALVVYSRDARPLERFVWDVSRFPHVEAAERELLMEREPDEPDAAAAAASSALAAVQVDMEEQFRAVLARLSTCDARLKPLPSGCTFTVVVEVKEEAEPPIGHPQPWIPVEPSLQARRKRAGQNEDEDNGAGKRRKGEDLGGVKTTPVRAVEAGEMVFEMWIEEGRAKMDMSTQQDGSSAGSI